MNLPAITAALAEVKERAAGARVEPAPDEHRPAAELERQLHQQDRELTAARARVAELEAQAAAGQPSAPWIDDP